MPVDTAAATDRLMRMLAVEGVTGQEAAIGRTLAPELKESGVPATAIYLDAANPRIPVPTQTGNLIVHLPGRARCQPQRLMFMTHMDTVPLCAGAVPVLKEQDRRNAKPPGRRQSHRLRRSRHSRGRPCQAETAASADHASIHGARGIRVFWRALPRQSRPWRPGMAFNFDGRSAADIAIGAIGADRWEVEIFGKAAHAGVDPNAASRRA